MDILEAAAKAFEKLLNINYEFILGRKWKTTVLHLSFHKEDFFHLAGLQYLDDIPKLRSSREIVFNNICTDEKFRNYVLSSQYLEKIQDRMKHLSKLEDILDSNETVFKIYQLHYSKIKADYILLNEAVSYKLYIFIKQVDNNNFICNSFFSNDNKDYVSKQTKMTMLFKKKLFIDNPDKDIVFIDKLTPKKI